MLQKKHRRRVQKKTTEIVFDKYDYYRRAVQSPETDVEFIRDTYKEIKNKSAVTLREDFCGTFAISTEWIKLNPKHKAVGLDLDPEPIEYGKSHHLQKLKPEQQKRLQILQKNVMDPGLPVADVALAVNFSYFCFKTRDLMKAYFKNVLKSLNKDGIFMLDIFGGKQCQDQIVDRINVDGFTYFWDQTGYDPITNEALFHIHFKIKGKKIENVFTYDWRLWTIPELRDLLHEVGFQKTHIYWEGTAKDGRGNGVFTRTEKGEACESWIAYIVAEK